MQKRLIYSFAAVYESHSLPICQTQKSHDVDVSHKRGITPSRYYSIYVKIFYHLFGRLSRDFSNFFIWSLQRDFDIILGILGDCYVLGCSGHGYGLGDSPCDPVCGIGIGLGHACKLALSVEA